MAESSYATLSLGSRTDAITWNNGCDRLGFSREISIRTSSPSLADLDTFFASSANWLFFGGHFGSYTLLNEDSSTKIVFAKDKVVCKTSAGSKTYSKGAEFQLHISGLVILWGGCDVCSGGETVRTMRALFDEHVLLGFAGLTGWKMVDAMLGGGFLKSHFFTYARSSIGDVNGMALAWMKAAQKGYGGGENESKFRAVDMLGQEWILKKGKIQKGRVFT